MEKLAKRIRSSNKQYFELEIKLYAVRKELKNCYEKKWADFENCFGAVGDHANTGA